jgi:hypothetical protein
MWPDTKGHKKHMVEEIAQQTDVETMTGFMKDYLPSCKQHVYLFHCNVNLKKLPTTLLQKHDPLFRRQRLQDNPSRERRTDCYVIHAPYVVYLREPPDRLEIDHLWPVLVEVEKGLCIVRFAKLERDMRAEFPERHLKTERTVTEPELLNLLSLAFQVHGGLRALDFNKGIKKLVEIDAIDCSEFQSKYQHWTTTRTMDADYTMKKDLPPEIYEGFKRNPILRARVRVLYKGGGIEVFGCSPTYGTIDFSQYSKRDATDYVLQQIIQNN